MGADGHISGGGPNPFGCVREGLHAAPMDQEEGRTRVPTLLGFDQERSEDTNEVHVS